MKKYLFIKPLLIGYYCKNLKKKYPTVLDSFSKDKNFINPYLFVEELASQLNKKDIIIPDDGGHLTWFMQSFKVKLGQRVFSAFGNSPMGYSFPAAIGASLASEKQRTICIDGDGSFQINIQELQTVVNEKLPIKIFIFNNFMNYKFQSFYLGGRYNASGKGVSVPNYKNIKSIWYKVYVVRIKNKKCYKKAL